MNQSILLGMVDSIEATILEGKKVPFGGKVVVDEAQVLAQIDKLRTLLKDETLPAQLQANRAKDQVVSIEEKPAISENLATNDTAKTLQDAESYGSEIRQGANEYADYILANLHLMLTKLQKDILKLEQTIQTGRQMIDERKNKEE